MENFKPRNLNEESGNIIPIDALTREGHMKQDDMPGHDDFNVATFDKDGKVLQPGANIGGSIGNYMEDNGPMDQRRRATDLEDARAHESGLSIVENLSDESKEDDAAERWLRENDPNHPGYRKKAA